MQRGISFKAYKDSSAQIRTETYLGRDWMVVPVVALVEGVLQGMNSPVPELALSAEFGKVPEGWNGRPIVMNHPVIDGIPVTANSPTVLETYSFGQIFNARVEDNKLKVDAFIDLARVETLGGEISDTVARLNAGEVVEVSTGLYAGMEEVSGKFNGKEYFAVWRDVVPDHLAFLSAGVIGACSVEDGCGTPRINSAAKAAQPAARWNAYDLVTSGDSDHHDCGCGCGGTCEGGNAVPKTQTDATLVDDTISADKVEMSINVQTVVIPEGQTIKTFEKPGNVFCVQQFIANAIPDGIYSDDVRLLLQNAMRQEDTYGGYIYVMGFTASKVIFESYVEGIGWGIFQRSYTISDAKDVTLADDSEQVLLLTEIMPAKRAKPGDMKANSADETGEPTVNETGDDDMTTKTDSTAGSTPADTNTNTNVTPAPAPIVDNSAPVVPKIKTQAEYLSDMPEEMREVMASGLKLHAEKKAGIIKALKDTGRCKFSDDQLNGFNLETLESLASLSQIPQTYNGLAAPVPTIVDNSADQPDAMPELFPVKAA